MLVHADEALNKLLGIVCEVFKVFALRHVLVEIFEVKTLVRRSAVGPVADAGSLEVFFGDLDLVPESVQRVDHVRSMEFHLVSNLVQEKLHMLMEALGTFKWRQFSFNRIVNRFPSEAESPISNRAISFPDKLSRV